MFGWFPGLNRVLAGVALLGKTENTKIPITHCVCLIFYRLGIQREKVGIAVNHLSYKCQGLLRHIPTPWYQCCSISWGRGRLSWPRLTFPSKCTNTRLAPTFHPSLVQEDHQTQVETAQERINTGRPVGQDYIPLSQSPQLSQLTFGRKPRNPSAELPLPKSTTVGTVVEEGGGGSGGVSVKSEKRLPLLMTPPSPMAGKNGLASDLNSLAVVGGAARANIIDSRGGCSEMASAASSRHTATSSGKGKFQQQQQPRLIAPPTMSNRGAVRRVNFGADTTKDEHGRGGSIITPASPELLYGSGRITAARYHDMLAEMDGRGGGGGAAGDTGVGISRLRGATPTATRKAAVPSQSSASGVRRRTEPTIKRR